MLRAAQGSVRPGLPVQALPAASRPSKAVRWAWLAAPVWPSQSRAVTETRVVATDADARARFRRYWAAMSPGILLIRKKRRSAPPSTGIVT